MNQRSLELLSNPKHPRKRTKNYWNKYKKKKSFWYYIKK